MVVIGEETILHTIVLAPAEILGIQSTFSSLFGFSHNGGTWFISCILICYAVYPLLQEMIKRVSRRTRVVLLLACVAILLYAPIVVWVFKLQSIYSNPFFRLLEFFIGMILAAMKIDYEDNAIIKKYIYNWLTISIINLVMIIGVSFAVRYQIAVGNYMLYSWFCLPCFIIILFGSSGVASKLLENSKVLKWMSGISYVFFLAQLFSNKISAKIISIGNIDSNILKILIGWNVCFAIAICFRFVEVRLKRALQKRFMF